MNFLEYEKSSFSLAKKQDKPIFILISAEWCHWCHVFADQTLSSPKVYSYLNDNFISILVDADIRSDVGARYQASTLPYVIFLEHDGTLLSKYGGSLDAIGFLGLLKSMKAKVETETPANNRGWEGKSFAYSPPGSLELYNIEAIEDSFLSTISDNYDWDESGVGGERKHLLPNTFLYLLRNTSEGSEFHGMVKGTLDKAIKKIYDPLEGGFFRYAETHDWKIPHYEKMLDVNSAAILLLLNSDSSSGNQSRAAEKTMEYLSRKLYDPVSGSFVSFQNAHASYYLLPRGKRINSERPSVSSKVFAETLSLSLSYLLEAGEYKLDDDFAKKIKSSAEFLLQMAGKGDVRHYYSVEERKWRLSGTMAGHAHLALALAKAYRFYGGKEYKDAALAVLNKIHSNYYNQDTRIYQEGPHGAMLEFDYQMNVNSVIVQAWLELWPQADQQQAEINMETIEGVLKYFSGTAEILPERAWDARDFGFLEAYASYLVAAKGYMKFAKAREGQTAR